MVIKRGVYEAGKYFFCYDINRLSFIRIRNNSHNKIKVRGSVNFV